MAAPRVLEHVGSLPAGWWREPFMMRAEELSTRDAGSSRLAEQSDPLEDLLRAHLGGSLADVFPRGMHTPERAAVRRSRTLARALDGELSTDDPSYALVVLSPRRYHELLKALELREPASISRSRLPEAECEAALSPTNLTAHFEAALRTRMLALAGGVGAGMHLHRDDPPFSSWHMHVSGAKRWLLCPTRRVDNATCRAATLRAGESLFYPHGWYHRTHALERGTASISRSLTTRGNAPAVAHALARFCDEARALEPEAGASSSTARWCAALWPCLLRLARVRYEAHES